MQAAQWIAGAVALYVAIGAAFAVAFVTGTAATIDPAVRGSGWSFRLLIFPGAVALWPLLVRRCLR
jgi:hypothetical protein